MINNTALIRMSIIRIHSAILADWCKVRLFYD